jgi:hypothetical protein
MRHVVPDALVNDNEMTGWLGFYLLQDSEIKGCQCPEGFRGNGADSCVGMLNPLNTV